MFAELCGRSSPVCQETKHMLASHYSVADCHDPWLQFPMKMTQIQRESNDKVNVSSWFEMQNAS